MKQIIQDLKSGDTILFDLPSPKVKAGHVLIKTSNSLVSLGTERMLVDFGKSNYIQKARQQPDKVKQVINKIKTDGLKPTVDAVFRKLNEPLPLGYCNAGIVLGVGKGVDGFQIGDRVASNGCHAEVVNIPHNLVVKIPEKVSMEDASFTVIGSIGLQGIRLLNPTFGETIVVFGLGLIGLITAQLLKANGCNVIGIDFDKQKLDLASGWGIDTIDGSLDNNIEKVLSKTNNIGCDGVIITASAKTNSIISESAQMCRKRGRVILVGVVGLSLNRSEFYEKEISFQVSCSYGPGRYDNNYEEKGMDYPVGFVRWTEKRNFEAFLNALEKKQINVKPLISERIQLEDYNKIYNNLSRKDIIASILVYENSNRYNEDVVQLVETLEGDKNNVVGIIGSGNFTSAMVLPALKKNKIPVKTIVSSKGLSGTLLARKYNIKYSSTDFNHALKDDEIKSVIITTRHNSHASQVISSLKCGKNVFVEKPLALSLNEIDQIKDLSLQQKKSVTVGFNRRFSPFSIKAKQALGDNPGVVSININVNSGYLEKNHWTQDIEVGGGRIVGEACHFIDLISFFTSSKVKSVLMNAAGINPLKNTDNATIVLKMENGSIGTINYFSNGNKSYPKEKIEIFQEGKNILIENFKSVKFFGYNRKNKKGIQDKGHMNQFNLWNLSVQNGGESIIPLDEIVNVSKSAILCLDSLSKGNWVNVV